RLPRALDGAHDARAGRRPAVAGARGPLRVRGRGVTARVLLLLPAALAAIAPADVAWPSSDAPARVERLAPERTACEGARGPLPEVLTYALRSGAFPGSPTLTRAPDVAVHVPPGFDGTRRPGLVVYFHGWSGCAAAALS